VIQLDKQDDILSRLIENYIRQLFDDREVSEENQIALWKYYNENLSTALSAGYSASSQFFDEDLAKALMKDIAKFSAFKATSWKEQLEDALVKDGKIVPWNEFKKTALELNVDYNQRWLKTEYNHTIAMANSVEQWKSYEADADLYPNLKYNAVNDARTREKHLKLDGLIYPINHDFWKTNLPPNDWGCRCTVEQSDETPTVELPEILSKGVFKNNAALSGKIFGEMPYSLNKKQQKEANDLADLNGD
jgi:SPP1 gp7 family putative phage head morphogenesis protein